MLRFLKMPENNNLKLNQFKLIALTLIFIMLQIIINAFAKIYIDLLGVLLIVLLVNQLYVYRQLIVIAFLADLIGHWYLGTHLFAVILISFLTDKNYNFYKMSNAIQKNISIIIFYSLFSIIIGSISILTHNIRIDMLSFCIEALILCPCVFLIIHKLFSTTSQDMFY